MQLRDIDAIRIIVTGGRRRAFCPYPRTMRIAGLAAHPVARCGNFRRQIDNCGPLTRIGGAANMFHRTVTRGSRFMPAQRRAKPYQII